MSSDPASSNDPTSNTARAAKHKPRLLAAAAVTLAGLGACNGDHTASAPPVPSGPQAFDTAQVLALAQQTSETAAPLPVNEGALTLSDTSETSAPITVNGT